MGTVTFHNPAPDELPTLFRVSMQGYGVDPTPETVAHWQLVNEVDRTYGARDGDTWVSCSSAFSFEVTLPGPSTVPASGVTMVGVEPTHRRRGILRQMIAWQHADALRRSEPLALLTASEASIYRRFGYGVVTDTAQFRIACSAVEFDPPGPPVGPVRLVDLHHATDELAALYDAARHDRPGWVSRNERFWALLRADPPHDRDGATELKAVLHLDAAGQPDGYATWRIKASDDGRVATNTVRLEELVGLSSDAELALWRFLADIDLATTIVWGAPAATSPLRWRLVEPRQLHIDAASDLVWARLLDIPAVLGARGYDATGTLLLDVHDASMPEVAGTYALAVDDPAAPARCTRLDPHAVAGTGRGVGADAEMRLAAPGANDAAGAPRLRLDVADLASLTFGAVSATTLAHAGRIEASDDAAIRLADALFASHAEPSCPIEF